MSKSRPGEPPSSRWASSRSGSSPGAVWVVLKPIKKSDKLIDLTTPPKEVASAATT